jgi:hypothetical protein
VFDQVKPRCTPAEIQEVSIGRVAPMLRRSTDIDPRSSKQQFLYLKDSGPEIHFVFVLHSLEYRIISPDRVHRSSPKGCAKSFVFGTDERIRQSPRKIDL